MDASQAKESVPIFIGVGWRLMDTKVRIPTIKSYELNKGFIFLEDVGSTHLLDKVNEGNATAYYEKAIKTLVTMQEAPSQGLEPYDMNFLLEEMNLMPQWYLKEHLGRTCRVCGRACTSWRICTYSQRSTRTASRYLRTP